MKVLVAIKAIADPSVAVRVLPDGSGLDRSNARLVMNPYDEVALEAAVQLREQGVAAHVTAAAFGGPECEAVLRTALAIGAARAIRIDAPTGPDVLAAAAALREVAIEETADLVLTGKQAADDDRGDLGPMVAALLGWPQATAASAIRIADGVAFVRRETDMGAVDIAADLPCVITTDPRLNAPRFAPLGAVLAARKAQITLRAVAPRNGAAARAEHYALAERQRERVHVSDARELVRALRQRGAL